MIRFFFAFLILFTSSTLFAFEAHTPLSPYKGRYSVSWWNCSRPTKAGLTLVNRIVVYDTTLTLAGCANDNDLKCEAQGNFNTQLIIQSMKSNRQGFSAFASKPMFNYAINFGRSKSDNQFETVIRMTSTVGLPYDVTCTSVLVPIH
jgi:hypothetical protein